MAANDRPADIQWLVSNVTDEITGYISRGREMGPPAFVQDGVLVGPAGPISLSSFGPRTLTVAASGANFSNLDDALAYRDTQGHIELATGLTGTITYTAGLDSRVITLTGTPLTSLVHLKGIVGVRLGGPGNPILRATIIATNLIQLFAPIAATFSGVQVDVYHIVPYGIAIMPGEIIELPNSGDRVIPAFTSIFCPVALGASIFHSSSTAGTTFVSRDDQNYITIKDLVFGDSTHKINSTLLNIAPGSATNCQTLCEYFIQDCELHTASQDFIYASNGAQPNGAIHIVTNRFTGTYDIVNPAYWRHFDMRGNSLSINSKGDYNTGGGDGGSPAGVVFGGGDTSTYPIQKATIHNNTIEATGVPSAANEGVLAAGVEIRNPVSSNFMLDVQGNNIYCNKIGGTDVTYPAAVGVFVSEFATGSNTPSILVRNNTFDCVATNGAAGTAYSMHSTNINYSIKRSNNFVKNGTLGSNTAAMTVI